MPDKNQSYKKFSYDAHARTCAPDDFLGQTRRTVQGVPVSEDQIQMIIAAIKSGLELAPADVLLELACGNGYLSRLLFGYCQGYLGTDISEYLVSVAKRNFEALPHYQFLMSGATEYINLEPQPQRFTKVLCYAGFQYFSDEEAHGILKALFDRFCNVQTIFIGNIPDRDRAANFYKTGLPSEEELSDSNTAIGIWRSMAGVERLAGGAGWQVQFSFMPAEFNGSHYRYDALLRR